MPDRTRTGLVTPTLRGRLRQPNRHVDSGPLQNRGYIRGVPRASYASDMLVARPATVKPLHVTATQKAKLPLTKPVKTASASAPSFQQYIVPIVKPQPFAQPAIKRQQRSKVLGRQVIQPRNVQPETVFQT